MLDSHSPWLPHKNQPPNLHNYEGQKQEIGKTLTNIFRILFQGYKARILVDDAHGIGVLGANGRGTAEYFGLEDEVDMIMGTFSKSFASLGGFLVASEPVCHYVQHVSRP